MYTMLLHSWRNTEEEILGGPLASSCLVAWTSSLSQVICRSNCDPIESSSWLRWTIEAGGCEGNPLCPSHLVRHARHWFCIIVTSKQNRLALLLSVSVHERETLPCGGVRVHTRVHKIDVLVFVFVRREQASTRKGVARKVEGGGNRNIRLMADVLHFRLPYRFSTRISSEIKSLERDLDVQIRSY